MGWMTVCVALVTMLLMLGCAATVKDSPAPGERIIAREAQRGWLATCLDHHLEYAQQMGHIGIDEMTDFAIARCAVLSKNYTHDPLIDIYAPWEPVTADELESCKSIAYAGLRSASSRAYKYTATRRFYALSVCIPTLGTS